MTAYKYFPDIWNTVKEFVSRIIRTTHTAVNHFRTPRYAYHAHAPSLKLNLPRRVEARIRKGSKHSPALSTPWWGICRALGRLCRRGGPGPMGTAGLIARPAALIRETKPARWRKGPEPGIRAQTAQRWPLRHFLFSLSVCWRLLSGSLACRVRGHPNSLNVYL